MDYSEFDERLRSAVPPGTVFPNPGGGTSTVLRYTPDKMAYLRGHSTIYVALRDLYDAYAEFAGTEVTSGELRAFAPRVFDSKNGGHSCNCTFLFLVLAAMDLSGAVMGSGRRGDPFSSHFRRDQAIG